MGIEAPQVIDIGENETRVAAVSFVDKLDSGELLTGTPVVTELTSSDLTLGNKAVNTAALTVNGKTVAIGQGVQFSVSGATAGTLYRIKVSCGTDATPAQTLIGIVRVRGVTDTA